MIEQPSKVNRRFTIWELVAYVSSFGVAFGATAIMIGSAAVIMLIGLGAGMCGRRHWALPGVMAAIVILFRFVVEDL